MLRFPFFALFVLLRVGLPEANDQRQEGGQDVAAWESVSKGIAVDNITHRPACRNMKWRDRDGKKCKTYVREGWCTTDGKYGTGWQKWWGSFETKKEKGSGVTADVACCGCGGGLRDSTASGSPVCKLPSGPHFKNAYGTCARKRRWWWKRGRRRNRKRNCNSVCDCQGSEHRLTCGCTDNICQQQCPFIPQQAVSERRRSWRRLRRRMRWGGGIIGAAFTFRRRHCVGDGIGPIKWTPRRRRRQCRALRVNDPLREVLRPLPCDATVVPGYFDAGAFEENGCRRDEAMCLRWNRTSRSFWVFGLAKVNNEDARCIGLNTQWSPPANFFTLQWVSTPGRYFLGTHQSALGRSGRYVYQRSGNIPNLPWHALNRLHNPGHAPLFRSLTQCCTWMDPERAQHPYCEIDRMCQIPGIGTSTCQYELCSIDQNDKDPKCRGYTNPKDNMCKCRDTDQPLQEPR